MLLAALLLTDPVRAADSRPLAAGHIDTFLRRIEGAWRGQAAITPIGPRPYDITFTRGPTGALEGTAEPGRAIHHWSFDCADGTLKLRFTSSFRGNRQPLLLMAVGETDGALMFRAAQPDFLAVRIAAGESDVLIQVLHHDRLHVEIRLRRRGAPNDTHPSESGPVLMDNAPRRG